MKGNLNHRYSLIKWVAWLFLIIWGLSRTLSNVWGGVFYEISQLAQAQVLQVSNFVTQNFLLNFVNFEIYEKIREIVKFGSVPEYPIIFRKFKSWMIFRLIKWHQSKQTANDKMVVHSHRNIYFHVWSFQKHRSSEFSLKYFRSSRSQIFFRIIALRRATLLKRDSNSGVFRWILRKF